MAVYGGGGRRDMDRIAQIEAEQDAEYEESLEQERLEEEEADLIQNAFVEHLADRAGTELVYRKYNLR